MRSGSVISIIVCAVLLFSLPVPAALADNVWNLPGGMLLRAVRENERYNGYSALTYLKIQDSAAAVMANREHALLLFACKENGKTVLLECHAAVRQPGEKSSLWETATAICCAIREQRCTLRARVRGSIWTACIWMP